MVVDAVVELPGVDVDVDRDVVDYVDAYEMLTRCLKNVVFGICETIYFIRI